MSQAAWRSEFSRPYLTFNSAPWHLRDAFLEHVSRTGMPEDFPGVCLDPVSRNETFNIVANFEIEGRKRPDGLMAPCPMCQHSNHYLKGALVYFPRLKVITPIGHECADQHVLRAARAQDRIRRDQELEESFLWARLPLFEPRLAWARQIGSVAQEAEAVYRRFRKSGAAFRKVLSASIKNNAGSLVIHEVRKGEFANVGPSAIRSQGGVQTMDINYGQLRGTTALLRDYSPVRDVDDPVRRFLDDGLGNMGPIDEERALDIITALDSDSRRRMYQNLSEAEKGFRKALRRLEDFQAFFGAANLARITEWAAHPESPMRFSATVRDETIGGSSASTTVRVFALEGDKDRCRVVLPPALSARLPPFPEVAEN